MPIKSASGSSDGGARRGDMLTKAHTALMVDLHFSQPSSSNRTWPQNYPPLEPPFIT
jgi:hypothetical protein